MHHLGATRSSLKHDHLLHTPDTFVRIPLPGATNVDFIVHAGQRLGAAFSWSTAEFAPAGFISAPAPGIQRFLYVLHGQIELTTPSGLRTLTPGMFAYLPADTAHTLSATQTSSAAIVEKPYQPLPGNPVAAVVVGDESLIPSKPLGGDDTLQVRNLMPDGPAWDFAVNTITYQPGAALYMVEVHVMEHGLLMLEGGGIYRLGDNWYPVQAGDFIWMGPYCPQWFGALGKQPAKYLIYKDWYRNPIGV